MKKFQHGKIMYDNFLHVAPFNILQTTSANLIMKIPVTALIKKFTGVYPIYRLYFIFINKFCICMKFV